MSPLDKILFGILSCFTFGILFSALSLISFVWLILFFIPLFFLVFYSERKITQTILLFIACSISFTIGVVRFTISAPEVSPLEGRVGEEITLAGIITSDPDIRDLTTKFILETKTDSVLATVSSGAYAYGDRVEVSGVLEKPENFETNTNRTFDYISYLSKDAIYFLIPKGKVTVIAHNEGNKVQGWLYSLKHKILSVFEKIISEPERSLLGGILLGTKQSLDTQTRDALVATGTIHIVALSGYNVSIASAFFMQLFSRIGSQVIVSIGGVVGIMAFVIMTGASSTAVRAGIMASLFIIARLLGRPYDALRILGVTAGCMLLVNPQLLVSDISFQLSFIATAGIILLEPIIRGYFIFLKWRWLISLVSVTLSAQIAVLPFLVWAMGTLSLVSLPVNFIVLPIVEVVMLLGFMTALLGIFIFPLAIPIGYITYLFLHTLLIVVSFWASFSYSAIIIPQFSSFIVLGIYAALLWWIYTKYKNSVIS